MKEALSLVWTALVGLFRSPASLAAEILVLPHQINILRRQAQEADLQRHGPQTEDGSGRMWLNYRSIIRESTSGHLTSHPDVCGLGRVTVMPAS
jgi:hypothetical protein